MEIKYIDFTIKGRPASKKNSKRWIYRGGRKFLVPSEAHDKFNAHGRQQLNDMKIGKFTGDVRINYVFYQKGGLSQDVDNAMCSINDLLQDAKIIKDDKQIKKGGFSVIVGAEDWETKVTIFEI